MKKTKNNFIKKVLSTCILITLCLSAVTIQKANAYVDKTYGWYFGIDYFIDPATGTITKNPLDGSNNVYKLSGNSIVFDSELYTTFGFTNPYVWLDNTYLGNGLTPNGNKNLVMYKFVQSGYYYYDTLKLSNLTPGIHKIKLLQDRPFNIKTGTVQKQSCLYINVPETTTTSSVTVSND